MNEKPKSGYKVNREKDGNKFYNKEILKEENVKRKKKEKEKKIVAHAKISKAHE